MLCDVPVILYIDYHTVVAFDNWYIKTLVYQLTQMHKNFKLYNTYTLNYIFRIHSKTQNMMQ